jgi:putative pyruvate formate lyase activating enzyme
MALFDCRESIVEESAISPSYLLSLAGCNWECCFCNVDQGARTGRTLSRQLFSRLVDEALDAGMKTVQFTGGEPALHADGLHELLRGDGRLPAVLNTNLSVDLMGHPLLEHLAGLVCSVKFGRDQCAMRLAGVADYVGLIRGRAVALHRRFRKIIVRHLLMPGHIDCCLKPTALWMAAGSPGATLSLLTGYVPPVRSDEAPELLRCLRPDEIDEAVAFCAGLGLDLEVSSWRVPGAAAAAAVTRPRPNRAMAEEVEMVIDAAGRICFSGFSDSCARLLRGLSPIDECEGEAWRKPD